MPYVDMERQRQAQSDWTRRVVAERRAEWFARMGGACVDCGSTTELEADHVDFRTKVSHRIWTWTKERREVELAKCAPRCRGCHLAKTLRDRRTRTPIKHGGKTMYSTGCKCLSCRMWKRAENRRYRKRP